MPKEDTKARKIFKLNDNDLFIQRYECKLKNKFLNKVDGYLCVYDKLVCFYGINTNEYNLLIKYNEMKNATDSLSVFSDNMEIIVYGANNKDLIYKFRAFKTPKKRDFAVNLINNKRKQYINNKANDKLYEIKNTGNKNIIVNSSNIEGGSMQTKLNNDVKIDYDIDNKILNDINDDLYNINNTSDVDQYKRKLIDDGYQLIFKHKLLNMNTNQIFKAVYSDNKFDTKLHANLPDTKELNVAEWIKNDEYYRREINYQKKILFHANYLNINEAYKIINNNSNNIVINKITKSDIKSYGDYFRVSIMYVFHNDTIKIYLKILWSKQPAYLVKKQIKTQTLNETKSILAVWFELLSTSMNEIKTTTTTISSNNTSTTTTTAVTAINVDSSDNNSVNLNDISNDDKTRNSNIDNNNIDINNNHCSNDKTVDNTMSIIGSNGSSNSCDDINNNDIESSLNYLTDSKSLSINNNDNNDNNNELNGNNNDNDNIEDSYEVIPVNYKSSDYINNINDDDYIFVHQ